MSMTKENKQALAYCIMDNAVALSDHIGQAFFGVNVTNHYAYLLTKLGKEFGGDGESEVLRLVHGCENMDFTQHDFSTGDIPLQLSTPPHDAPDEDDDDPAIAQPPHGAH